MEERSGPTRKREKVSSRSEGEGSMNVSDGSDLSADSFASETKSPTKSRHNRNPSRKKGLEAEVTLTPKPVPDGGELDSDHEEQESSSSSSSSEGEKIGKSKNNKAVRIINVSEEKKRSRSRRKAKETFARSFLFGATASLWNFRKGRNKNKNTINSKIVDRGGHRGVGGSGGSEDSLPESVSSGYSSSSEQLANELTYASGVGGANKITKKRKKKPHNESQSRRPSTPTKGGDVNATEHKVNVNRKLSLADIRKNAIGVKNEEVGSDPAHAHAGNESPKESKSRGLKKKPSKEKLLIKDEQVEAYPLVNSLTAYGRRLFNKMAGETSISITDAIETDSSYSGSTTLENTRPSCRAFKSLNFMFPEERAAARLHCYKTKGYIKKVIKDKVRFDDMAQWMVYDPNAPQVHYDNETFMESNVTGVVYLRTEQSLDVFTERYPTMNPAIYSDEKNAKQFWDKLKAQGKEPPLREGGMHFEDDDTVISAGSNNTINTGITESEYETESEHAAMTQEIVRYEDEESQMDKLATSSHIDNRLVIELDPDLDSFRSIHKQFIHQYTTVMTGQTSLSQDREFADEKALEEVISLAEIASTRKVLDNVLFKFLFRKYLNLSQINKFLDNLKLGKVFRRLTSHKIFGKKEFIPEALNSIVEFLELLRTESKVLDETELDRKTLTPRTFAGLKELKPSGIKDLRRKIVTKKDNEKFVVDFISGKKFEFEKEGQGGMKELDTGKVYPPPEFIAPDHWRGAQEFFLNPKRAWQHQKLKFAEQYFNVVNSGLITAIMNENEGLVSVLTAHKIPSVVASASMYYREHQKEFDLKGVRTTERTNNHRSILRRAATAFGTGDKSGTTNGEKQGSSFIIVDAMCGAINASVRADLLYSRRRNSCHENCTGHRGKLLLTMIRLGSVKMVKHLLDSGIRVDVKTCSGPSKDLYWEYDPKMLAKMRTKQGKQSQANARARKRAKNAVDEEEKETDFAGDANDQSPENNDLLRNVQQQKELGDEVTLKRERIRKAEIIGEADAQPPPSETVEPSKPPDVKRAIQSTLNVRQMQQKKANQEKDVTYQLDSRRGMLTSKYENYTPLATAVDCAVTTGDSTVLRFFLDGNDDDKYKPKINICDNLAIRACMPVLEKLAKAKRKRNKEIERQKQLILKKRPSVVTTLKQLTRTGSLMNLKRPDTSKSAGLSDHDTLTDRVLHLHHEKDQIIAALAKEGTECLRLITNEAREEMAKEGDNSEKFKGNFNTIVIKIALIYEALIQEKWEVVRMVAPSVTNASGNEFKLFEPSRFRSSSINSSGSSLSRNERKIVHFEPVVALSLTKAIDVLLNAGLRKSAATHARTLNAIYFLMVEYNIYPERRQMNKLVEIITMAMDDTVTLRPGDQGAILRLFSTSQLKHYLQIKEYSYLEKRYLDQYTFKPSNKQRKNAFKSKNIARNMLEKRQYLIVLACGVGLREIVDILAKTKGTLDQGVLKEMLYSVTFFRQQLHLIPVVTAYCDDLGIETGEMLFKALHFCMSDSKKVEISDANVVHALLMLGTRPALSEARNYIFRTLLNPPLGMQSAYQMNDICRDLTRVFNFKILLDYIFFKGSKRAHEIVRKVFITLVKALEKVDEKYLFYQGLQYLLNIGLDRYPEFARSDKEEENFTELIKTLEQNAKHSMVIDEANHTVTMSFIEKDTRRFQEFSLDQLQREGQVVLHEVNGQVVSEIL